MVNKKITIEKIKQRLVPLYKEEGLQFVLRYGPLYQVRDGK